MSRSSQVTLASSASAIALLAVALTPQIAAAQTAAPAASAQDETQVDEIVVTGFRSSLQQALSIKRNEAGAVDAILAEDIADFPDQNLAEAIQA